MTANNSGWHFAGARQKNAPNFGGTEWWWEVSYRHDDGRTVMGAARTEEEADQRARLMMEYQDNPPPRQAGQDITDTDDCPF